MVLEYPETYINNLSTLHVLSAIVAISTLSTYPENDLTDRLILLYTICCSYFKNNIKKGEAAFTKFQNCLTLELEPYGRFYNVV